MSYNPVPVLFFIEQKKVSDSHELLGKIHQAINDERILSSKNGAFMFTYVGLISLQFCTVSVLPKFASNELSSSEREALTRYTVQVLQQYSYVSQKYNGLDFLDSEPDEGFYSEPVLADTLINYYIKYGIWEKEEAVYNINGSGNINWHLTVERTVPVIAGRNIFYPETVSSVKQSMANETITLVHQWATRYCIDKYSKLLPGYEGLQYLGDSLDDINELGTPEQLIDLLYAELRTVFADVKINLLNNLIWFLGQQAVMSETKSISFYGSSTFHHVWEDACKFVFNDISESSEIRKLFRPPVWISKNKSEFTTDEKSDFSNSRNVLIPDVVAYDQSDNTLLILDAKYYTLRFTQSKVSGNPGINDITKQIIYQQILTSPTSSSFLTSEHVINGFIFPLNTCLHSMSELQYGWLWGNIQSNIPGWENTPVHIFIVPPEEIFDIYIDRLVSTRPISRIKESLSL